MSIIFIYYKNLYKIDVKSINTINEALTKFISIIGSYENDLIFLYKGKEIKHKISLNKLNNIKISVYNIKVNKSNNICFILCPKCQNLSYLN